MATTQTSYGVVSLGDQLAEAEDDRGYVRLRRDLDVGAFGVSAAFQKKAGERWSASTTRRAPAPTGTRSSTSSSRAARRSPSTARRSTRRRARRSSSATRTSKRGAVATADDTIVLAVGGRRGEAYRLSPMMAATGFFDAYSAKDYAGALEATKRGLEAYPGNALLLYNVACMSALLGDRETAVTALAESVAKWEPYKELARGDDDFVSLRDDPKFVELVS